MEQDFNEKDWATPCPKYDCKKTACKCGLEYVYIPSSLGDDSEGGNVAPKNGAYCNALVVYEANNHVYIYSKEGVPTLIDVDARDISTLEQEVIKAQKDIHEFREDIDRFAYFFDTVADMKASDQLQSGDYARTLGYYSKNDGGGAYYKISSAQPSGYYENLGGLLCAELIVEDDINVKQYGVKPDATTDNSSKINEILSLGVKRLYFPNGEYYIASSITIPATCKTIEGEDRVETKILCGGDGLIYNDGTSNSIKNLTLIKKSPTRQGIGIQANFQGSIMDNVSIQSFDKAMYVDGNSWSNLYIRCRFVYNNYGFYKTNVGEVDWLDFYKCTLSYNQEAAVYIMSNNYNTNFFSCDFELNPKKAIVVGYNPRNLIIDRAYCHQNGIIFSAEVGYSTNGNVTIQKCWINQPETVEYGPGWLATAFTRTPPVQAKKACYITIKECNIFFHELTNKPFAFSANASANAVSMTCFNIYDNNYSGNDGVVPNNYPFEYFDLVDTTNFPKYMDVSQFRLPVKTDLMYKNLDDHLHWTITNRGVSNGYGGTSNLFHMFGYYEFESTGSTYASFDISRTCAPWENYNAKFYGMVRYTDGTMELKTISIQSEKVYIYGLDTSKTTKEIVLDVWYSGDSREV